MQIQWLGYHKVVGTLKPYLVQKNLFELFALIGGKYVKTLGTNARDISRVIACTRATWWNFHYLILYNCDVLVLIQIQRDQSSAYLLTNGTSRGLHLLAIGARQRLDIAMRKVDPWPRTNKSPPHIRTRANLQLFLANHRDEVIQGKP